MMCIAQCLLRYIEKIAEYFNKWAFIYVGLYGYGYIDAGKNVISLFKSRGWNVIISDNLVQRTLALFSFIIGLITGILCLLTALLIEGVENESGWGGNAFVIGLISGMILSGIMMGLIESAVDAIIVCFAEASAEFRGNHPELAEEMENAWASAWPDRGFGTRIAVVGLGGGLGVV